MHRRGECRSIWRASSCLGSKLWCWPARRCEAGGIWYVECSAGSCIRRSRAQSNQQWNALPAGAFSAGQFRALPTGTLDKFRPANFGAMPALVFGGMKAKQINAMGAKTFSTIGPTQVAAFKPAALTAVSGQQLKTMPAKAMIGLETKQIKAITTAALNGGMNRTKVTQIADHRCSHDNEATQTGDDQV